ncbi:hypothetical protein NDU88_007956 [Pleurodeles waltl]|uniref:Uncharacterized protein n=1 Tax=Pleurodeles waltl TaxID=8319 RepID=A0AAV7PRR6_PLEWA|nr:hypothetical protein NDU88_007956 [Pleurodeles waltl]
MGRHRQAVPSQGNTLEQYTTSTLLPQRLTRLGGPGEPFEEPATGGEPTCAELLAAIQGSRVALEGKRETVAVEVNLLRANLRKVSDKVNVAEGSIVDLQTEGGTLRKQMAQITSTVATLEARLEDSEVGVAEKQIMKQTSREEGALEDNGMEYIVGALHGDQDSSSDWSSDEDP